MAPLDGLLKLARIAEENQTVGSLRHGKHVGERHLRRFIDEQNIDGALRGVCVTTADASGCQRFGGIDDAGGIPPAMPTSGIALDDGSWVAVGSIGDDRTACAADQLGGAQMAVTSNGDQPVALVVPADLGQAFACSLQGPDGTAEPFIANTPAGV